MTAAEQQTEEIHRLSRKGFTHDQIAARTGVARSAVTTHLRAIALETGGELRCPQCWKMKHVDAFKNATGAVLLNCTSCRARMAQPWAERNATRVKRYNLRKRGGVRVSLTMRSANRKLGPIPSTITSSETCPPSCSFFGEGCFAEFHLLRSHWARVPQKGLRWRDFLDAVRAMPEGQLWRHNAAGDLPGNGEQLDHTALAELVVANIGRRGFTFTHKRPVSPERREAIRGSNLLGFTINLSADSLEKADELAALGIAPVAAVVASDYPERGGYTPAGRKVVVCPAERGAVTCATCALCAKPQRKAIVAFRAHGQLSKRVDQLVQIGRKP